MIIWRSFASESVCNAFTRTQIVESPNGSLVIEWFCPAPLLTEQSLCDIGSYQQRKFLSPLQIHADEGVRMEGPLP